MEEPQHQVGQINRAIHKTNSGRDATSVCYSDTSGLDMIVFDMHKVDAFRFWGIVIVFLVVHYNRDDRLSFVFCFVQLASDFLMYLSL